MVNYPDSAVGVLNERPPGAAKSSRNKYKEACSLQQGEFTNGAALLHCEQTQGLNVRVSVPPFLLCGLEVFTGERGTGPQWADDLVGESSLFFLLALSPKLSSSSSWQTISV